MEKSRKNRVLRVRNKSGLSNCDRLPLILEEDVARDTVSSDAHLVVEDAQVNKCRSVTGWKYEKEFKRKENQNKGLDGNWNANNQRPGSIPRSDLALKNVVDGFVYNRCRTYSHDTSRPGVLSENDHKVICNPYKLPIPRENINKPHLVFNQRKAKSAKNDLDANKDFDEIKVLEDNFVSQDVTRDKYSNDRRKKKRAKHFAKKTGKTVWRGLKGGWKLFWSGLMLFSAPLTSMDVATSINRAAYMHAKQQQQHDERYHDYNKPGRRPPTDYTRYDNQFKSRW